MAQAYEFVRMDSKGRIFVPSRIRSLLNLREGMSFMMIADAERHEIRLIPLADERAQIFRLTVLMDDVVGALSRVVGVVAEEGVDLLMTQSRTIRRGELAEWVAVADFSSVRSGVEGVVEKLRSLSIVKGVEVERLEPRRPGGGGRG